MDNRRGKFLPDPPFISVISLNMNINLYKNCWFMWTEVSQHSSL